VTIVIEAIPEYDEEEVRKMEFNEEKMKRIVALIEGEIGEERWDEICGDLETWKTIKSQLLSAGNLQDIVETVNAEGFGFLTAKVQNEMGWALRHMAILYTLNRYGMFITGSPGNWVIDFCPGQQQDWTSFIENLNQFTDDVVVLEDLPKFPSPYRHNAAKLILRNLVESRIALVRMGMAVDCSEAGVKLDEVIDLLYEVLRSTEAA